MEKNKKTLVHNTYPIILGIDPGYGRIGLAILKKDKNGERLLHSECFETDADLQQSERLNLISERLKGVIKKHKPQVAIIKVAHKLLNRVLYVWLTQNSYEYGTV